MNADHRLLAAGGACVGGKKAEEDEDEVDEEDVIGDNEDEGVSSVLNRHINIYDDGTVYAHFQIKDKVFDGWEMIFSHTDGRQTTISLVKIENDWNLMFSYETMSGSIQKKHYPISEMKHGHIIRLKHSGESDTLVEVS